MVHELLGIQDNKVDLRSIGKFPKDQQVDYVSSVAANIINLASCMKCETLTCEVRFDFKYKRLIYFIFHVLFFIFKYPC